MKNIKKVVIAALFCVAISSPALNAGFLDKVIGVLGKVQQKTSNIDVKLSNSKNITSWVALTHLSMVFNNYYGVNLGPAVVGTGISWGTFYWMNFAVGVTAGLTKLGLGKFQKSNFVRSPAVCMPDITKIVKQ